MGQALRIYRIFKMQPPHTLLAEEMGLSLGYEAAGINVTSHIQTCPAFRSEAFAKGGDNTGEVAATPLLFSLALPDW